MFAGDHLIVKVIKTEIVGPDFLIVKLGHRQAFPHMIHQCPVGFAAVLGDLFRRCTGTMRRGALLHIEHVPVVGFQNHVKVYICHFAHAVFIMNNKTEGLFTVFPEIMECVDVGAASHKRTDFGFHTGCGKHTVKLVKKVITVAGSGSQNVKRIVFGGIGLVIGVLKGILRYGFGWGATAGAASAQ